MSDINMEDYDTYYNIDMSNYKTVYIVKYYGLNVPSTGYDIATEGSIRGVAETEAAAKKIIWNKGMVTLLSSGRYDGYIGCYATIYVYKTILDSESHYWGIQKMILE